MMLDTSRNQGFVELRVFLSRFFDSFCRGCINFVYYIRRSLGCARYLFRIAPFFIALGLNAISPSIQDILDLFGMDTDLVERSWLQRAKDPSKFDKRYEYMRPFASILFEKGGYHSAIFPTLHQYDRALILGDWLPYVQQRIDFLSDLIKEGIQFKEIVFFTAHRELFDSEKKICNLSFESEMVEWAYVHSDLSKDLPVTFFHSEPSQDISDWKGWLDASSKSSILISNQPYIPYYQDLLQNSADFAEETLEIVGPAVKDDLPISFVLDVIAKQIHFSSGYIKKKGATYK